jgi:hypothetical protein
MEPFILSPLLFLHDREARRAEPRRSDERPDRGDEVNGIAYRRRAVYGD